MGQQPHGVVDRLKSGGLMFVGLLDAPYEFLTEALAFGNGLRLILVHMHALGTVFVDVIVGMFFLGLAGSSVVVLITFFEDFKELFGPDEGPEAPHGAPQTSSSRTKDEAPSLTAVTSRN